VGALLLVGGLWSCAPTPTVDPMRQHLEAVQRQGEVQLQQARAEVSAQRAELAAVRIAAAKQAAELQELRQQVGELRQANEAKQAEQVALRGERDRLVQVRNELQAQVGEVGRLRQALVELKGSEERAQAKVQELQAALVNISSELQKVRKASVRRQPKTNAKPEKTTMPPSQPPAPSKTESSIPQPKGSELSLMPSSGEAHAGTVPAAVAMNGGSAPNRVMVQRDETLWRIAHRHGVTVEQLQDANGLHGTRIREGQALLIPGK
jgi:LysM repeat protein